MNPAKAAFLIIVATLSITSSSHAQLYAAKISAALTTESISGSNYSTHTIPVTNSTIIKTLVTSGSFPGVTANDLAVVFDEDAAKLEVINTSSSNSIVTVLGSQGANPIVNAVENTIENIEYDTVTRTNFQFTIPSIAATQIVTITYSLKNNRATGAVENFSLSFTGGSGIYTAGSTRFQGTIKKQSKWEIQDE